MEGLNDAIDINEEIYTGFLQKLSDATGIEFLASHVLAKVLSCLLILLIGLLALRTAKRFLNYKEKQGKSSESIGFLRKMVKTCILCITAVFMLLQFDAFKSTIVSLLAGSGVVAVILGFASQDALGNLASGAMIMFTKPFEIGDRVKIPEKGIAGFVENMTMRHTIIRTFENTRMVIPNSIANGLIIENMNMTDKRVCNFFDVGIDYSADVDRACAIIREEITSHPAFVDNRTQEQLDAGQPAVSVICTNLGDSSVDLRTAFWTSDAGAGYVMNSDLRKSVKKRFDAEGIGIPFPQRTVHIAKDE